MLGPTSMPLVPTSDMPANYDGRKAQLKLLGCHDATSQLLRESVDAALTAFPIAHTILEICEPNAIAAAGVTATPALLLDGQLMVQGRVPSPAEVIEMFRDRDLQRSKLHRLRSIAVAVDISRGSDSALRFAWHVAQKAGADLEVVYVMDRLFDGHLASESGFLSSYQHTMQVELDAFIREIMVQIGVQHEPPKAGAPGEPPAPPASMIRSKVLYGSPAQALEECSQHVDLLVLGSTGRGAGGKKVFGSVSTEVSQRAHCPVLLVPPDAEFRGLQNLLYASHFDSLSTLRIRQALSFARHFDAKVHFVHVGPGGDKEVALEHKLLEASGRDAHPEQPFLFARIVGEDVLNALYDYALYHRIELLVFVTHQRNFWQNILHRSITREAAVSSDHLPMLIIHSDDDMLG